MSDFCTTGELLQLPNLTWLIKKHIPESGLSLLFGPSGEGKSFVAIDWACCVSTGQPWNGHRVKQGHVLYIAAEGGAGIKKRVAAWMQFNGHKKLPNITWFLNSLDFSEEGDMQRFMRALNDRFTEEPIYDEVTGDVIGATSFVNIRLVVVDTLSRCFGGMDENASTAMPVFVAHVEKFCRQHGAAGLIIHHSNATGARERGHTSLKAATEATFQCTASKDGARLNTITLLNIKQKDDIDGAETFLKPLILELPELPRDEDGDVLTSLVLEEVAHDEGADAIVEIIVEVLDGAKPMSKSALISKVREITNSGRNLVRKAIDTAIETGTVVVRKGDNNSWMVSLAMSSERTSKRY